MIGCFLGRGQGKQRKTVPAGGVSNWTPSVLGGVSKAILGRHWGESGCHSFYSHCMTLGETRSPLPLQRFYQDPLGLINSRTHFCFFSHS